jgi:hypothetical protein
MTLCFPMLLALATKIKSGEFSDDHLPASFARIAAVS